MILPGYPHHITQRGNRRQDVFFKEEDYYQYLELLKQWCAEEQVLIEPDDQFIRYTSTGRPLGGADFIDRAEKMLQRDLQKKKPGPKVDRDN